MMLHEPNCKERMFCITFEPENSGQTMNTPAKIFIAYSRKDVTFLDELRSHLTPLERSSRIQVWYDGNIEAGREWDASIKEALYSADIILLLVSADSISSEYFYGNEVNISLERHRNRQARVIPIVLRPCAWEDTPLAELQALPKDGVAVSNWSSRDNAYADIVKAISQLVKEGSRPVATPALSSLSATETPTADAMDEPASISPDGRPMWKRTSVLVGLFGGLAALVLVASWSIWNKPGQVTEKPLVTLPDTTVQASAPVDRFQTFMRNADSLFKISKFDLASDLYDSALVVRTDSYQARERKRKSQDELDRLDKNQRYEAVLKEAERLYIAGNYKSALAQFQKAAKVLPGEPRASAGISKCNTAQKKVEEAARKQQLERLVAEAQILQKAAKYAEAKAKYQEADKLFPNDKRVSDGIAACNRALIVNNMPKYTAPKVSLMNPEISSLSITMDTGNDDLRVGSHAYIVVGTKGKGKKEYLLNKGGISLANGSQKTTTVTLDKKVNQSDITYLGVHFQPSALNAFGMVGGRDNWLLDKIQIIAEGKTLLSKTVNKRFTSTDSVWGENVSF